jgi:hypothetical protein
MEFINLGVVQGSALGPFLFILMIADLLPLSSANCLVKYADDTTIFIPENSDVSAQQEYDNIKGYATTNKLTINVKKNKYSVFSKPRTKISDNSAFTEVECVKEIKLLGVVLDNKLSFQHHISSLLAVCSQRFYLLKLLRDQGMPLSCLHGVYVSIVVNRIAYCLSAWGGSVKQEDVNKINSLFRKARRCRFTDTVYDFEGLLAYSDEKLFASVCCDNHCLNHLLEKGAPESIELRERGHCYVLPQCHTNIRRRSCIPRLLYKFI